MALKKDLSDLVTLGMFLDLSNISDDTKLAVMDSYIGQMYDRKITQEERERKDPEAPDG